MAIFRNGWVLMGLGIAALAAAGVLLAGALLQPADADNHHGELTVDLADQPERRPSRGEMLRRPAPAPTADGAPPAVVDVLSLAPGAVYDRPFGARHAVDVDPAAPLVVVYSGPMPRGVFTPDDVSLYRGTERVELAELDWRSPSELAVVPATQLEPGELYSLTVLDPAPASAPIGADGDDPATRFVFRTRHRHALYAAAADFDLDGRVDLVTGGPLEPLQLYRNGGTVPEPPGLTLGVESGVLAIAAAELAGDRHPDLAVVRERDGGTGAELMVLVGTPDGFASPVVTPLDTEGGHVPPLALLAGDFAGSGWADLLVVDPFGRHRVLLNNRGRGFEVVDLAVSDMNGEGPDPGLVTAATVADLDRDSYADIALADAAGRLVWLANDRSGRRFRSRLVADDAGVVTGLAASDLDRDGRADLYAGRLDAGDDLYVAASRGSQTRFARVTPQGLSPEMHTQTRAIAVVDLNADRAPDLVAARTGAAGVAVNLNDRASGFSPPVQIEGDGKAIPAGIDAPADAGAATDTAYRLLGADFDGDGSADLFGVTTGGRSFYLLTGRHVFRQPPDLYGEVRFENRTDLLPGVAAGRVACACSGDVNRDGQTDVVLGLIGGGAEIWLGTADGRFVSDYVLHEMWGRKLVLIDADRDGDLDLLDVAIGMATSAGDPVVQVAWNGGVQANIPLDAQPGVVLDRGRFGSPRPLVDAEVPEPPTAAVVADLDQDGRVDVFLAGETQATLLLGRRDGSFASVTLPPDVTDPALTAPVSGALAADFDNDGRVDLVLATLDRTTAGRDAVAGAPNVWLRNVGEPGRDAAFEAVAIPHSAHAAVGLASGDFDANATPDLLWLDPDSRRLEMRLAGTGTREWERHVIALTDVFDGVDSLALLDLDGDGTPEPVICGALNGEGWQEIWRSTGYGGMVFAEAAGESLRETAAGATIRPLITADLTGNGRPDLICVDAHGNPHLFTTT